MLKAEAIALALKVDLKDMAATLVAEEMMAAKAKEKKAAERPTEPQAASVAGEAPAATAPAADERIEARFGFLVRAVRMFAASYDHAHSVKLRVDMRALRSATVYYFHAADERKQRSLSDKRFSHTAVGSLTSYALARFRPLRVVEAGGLPSEEQNDIITYVNEIMALSIGASIAQVDIGHSMLILIEMLKSGIDEMNFYRAFRLLKSGRGRGSQLAT